jgi:hypothetical protein
VFRSSEPLVLIVVFLIDLEEGRFFFNAVKEGDSVVFACDDENECHLWVMAMYRATGQAHKPTPLVQTLSNKNSTISRLQGGLVYDHRLYSKPFGIKLIVSLLQNCFNRC